MRSLLVAFLLAAVCSFAIPVVRDAVSTTKKREVIAHGVMCQPCINLITKGENGIEGDFDKWFQNETKKVCAETGFFAKDCQSYFMGVEEEVNHIIETHIEPLEACRGLDFCAS